MNDLRYYYLGIDPGMSGAISLIDNNETLIASIKMPRTERDIYNAIADLSDKYKPMKGCIEAVHAFPGQGVSSTFKFGVNYGFLRACIISTHIPLILVSPQKWQRHFSLLKSSPTETKSQHKNKIKQMAQNRFPSVHITLYNADAIMIALYCKQYFNTEKI